MVNAFYLSAVDSVQQPLCFNNMHLIHRFCFKKKKKSLRAYSLGKPTTEFAIVLSCKFVIKKTFSYYLFEVQTKPNVNTKCKAIGIKSVGLSNVFDLFHCYHEADCLTYRTYFMKWFRMLRLCSLYIGL